MMSRFDHAAQLLDLDPDLYKVLRVPNREITVYIPVYMDDGHLVCELTTPTQAAVL